MKELSCETVLMAAMAAADGHPATIESGQVEAHLAVCGDCRRELEALGGLVKLIESQKRRQSDDDLWSAVEPRLLDHNERLPADGNLRMWAPIALILLLYKLIEQIPDRHLALVYKLLPLLLVIAVFVYLKQNPFKINAELKLGGE
jgi:hypothetical protein